MLLFGWWVGCWLGLLVSRVCVFCHFAVVVVFVGFGILVVGGFLGRLAGVGVICFCVFRGIGCGWWVLGFGFLVWGVSLCGCLVTFGWVGARCFLIRASLVLFAMLVWCVLWVCFGVPDLDSSCWFRDLILAVLVGCYGFAFCGFLDFGFCGIGITQVVWFVRFGVSVGFACRFVV